MSHPCTPASVRASPITSVGHTFEAPCRWSLVNPSTGRRVLELWFDADDKNTDHYVIYLRVEPQPTPTEVADSSRIFVFSPTLEDPRPAVDQLIAFLFPEARIS